MARKMVVRQTDGTEVILTEQPAEDEAQLQAMLRDDPEVLPLDDFEGHLLQAAGSAVPHSRIRSFD